VWLLFDPQAGHEQSGRRPAIVVSPKAYNAKSGLALFCPITSQIKGYPFEVVLPADAKITGAVLTDQIKNLDWKVRDARLIHKVSPEILALVVAKVRTLIA
jgi:mRNA interferase MazF